MLRRARSGDCPELRCRRVELEPALLGGSIDYEECVRICESAVR
jgi:hypothetical protein